MSENKVINICVKIIKITVYYAWKKTSKYTITW